MYRSKQVTHYVFASTFGDAFDMAYLIKYDLQHTLQKAVKIHMPTDSLYLVVVIPRNQVTIEK